MNETPDESSSDRNSSRDPKLEKVLEYFGGVTGQLDAANKAYEYRRSKSRESEDHATFRRVSGKANEDLQADGFVLDGVSSHHWFASLDLPANTPGEVQDETARLIITAIAPTAEWANITPEMISIPPHTMMLMSQSSIYVRLSGISKSRVLVAAALVADLITHSPSIAVAASVAATIWDNVRRLSEEELEVFRAMQRVSNGHVYTEWLSTQSIFAELPKGYGKKRCRSLLASMKSRGILEEGDGLWRAVR